MGPIHHILHNLKTHFIFCLFVFITNDVKQHTSVTRILPWYTGAGGKTTGLASYLLMAIKD